MNACAAPFEPGCLQIRDLGRAPYRPVLAEQQALQAQRRAGEVGDTVLLVEHEPVITLGARASANRLLVDAATLAARGIDLVPVRRGGGGTAHNPGQLVVYPILDLQTRGWGISRYIETLERIGITLLETLGVQAEQVTGKRGLWVGPRKIASIGVRISRSITHHGMAINLGNDLRIFDYLVPCGLDGVVITSVERETGRVPDMDRVKETLVPILRGAFAPATPIPPATPDRP